jgi:hypothetical protein
MDKEKNESRIQKAFTAHHILALNDLLATKYGIIEDELSPSP